MSEENCNHNCSSCEENCPSRESGHTDFMAKPNPRSKVGHVIGIVSGKGGVGKSLVTSMLSVLLNRRGFHTGILDADITGPSIPKMFGLHGKVTGSDAGIIPAKTKSGIDVISVNLLLDDESAPVVWRGPLIGNIVKQFWTDVIWPDVDYLFVDMPPGTGDVPLTVFQSLPVDGIVVVTSPQELVSLIVSKAVNMAKMMNIPILGIVENMSYVKCPDCGKEIKAFGESHLDETAKEYGLKVLGRVPLDPSIAQKCDGGSAEEIQMPSLEKAADAVQAAGKK